MEQLDKFIFNAIQSLRHKKRQPNEDTIYATINKNLTSVTMEILKERLTILLGKEKLLNKPQGGKNSYFKIQNHDNLSPQTPFLPIQLPKTPIIKKHKY